VFFLSGNGDATRSMNLFPAFGVGHNKRAAGSWACFGLFFLKVKLLS
jgi:hypothetical protein